MSELWCRDAGCLHYDHPLVTASDAPVTAGARDERCTHDEALVGIDITDMTDPRKVWRCCACDKTGTDAELTQDRADEYARQLRAMRESAAAAEVRVEWGVRYVGQIRGGLCELWCDTEEDRDEVVTLRRRDGYDVETAERTVTTSPWGPA